MQSLIIRSASTSFISKLHQRAVYGYVFALGVYLAAFGVRLYFDSQLPPGLPFITFLPSVLIVAFFAGRGPALATALVSGLTAWYLFVAPRHSFATNGAVLLALLFYLLIVTIAITMIQTLRQTAERLEEERQANAVLAEQRAFLFRELQHRVANNMAFLVAILSMQKSVVQHRPKASEDVLDDAIRRIRLFSSIHRRLHDPDSAMLSLDAHFNGLFNDLIEATGAQHVRCTVETNGLRIAGEALTTLSLIATELMTNAIKHAFPGRDDGVISVSLDRRESELVFTIADNGIGKGDENGTPSGLGSTIVEALCEQLNARQTLSVDNGTRVEIIFPPPAMAQL